MVKEELAKHALITAILHLLKKLSQVRLLTCKLLRPNAEMRVSFSALLRICQGGRYVLVRNLHRHEVFGPFGGVFKYYQDAVPGLDTLLFRPQDVGPGTDMKSDLRGFIPRKNIIKMTKWYAKRSQREEPEQCLLRELREELKEVKLLRDLGVPKTLHPAHVRTVIEGPERVPGLPYTQYRIFEVYEARSSQTEVLEFFDGLFEEATRHRDLLVANSDEIIAGRAHDGRLIGHHSVYLVTGKRVRPDVPSFVSDS